MADEQKEPENTLESVSVTEPESEPQNPEPTPVMEATESVPEPTQSEIETTPETPTETETQPTEVTPGPETPQMSGIEPLAEIPVEKPKPEAEGAGATAEAPEESASTPAKAEREPRKQEEPEPTQKEKMGLLRQLAHATIGLRREKKLMKIMELFAKQTAITNDEVEKLLHVSDATATRYLAELEKRDKLKQVGTTGRGVSYVKR